MADKKNKKPRHQNLFVPGDGKPKKTKKAKPSAQGRGYSLPSARPRPVTAESPAAEESSHKGKPAAPPAENEAAFAPQDLFGGEGVLEEQSTPEGFPKGAGGAESSAAPAGEGLAQGGTFDDDDGMVLSGVAPVAPRQRPPDTKKKKKKKAPYKKKKGVFEELRSADPWGKQPEENQGNTIVMPKPQKKPRLSAAKRRKLFKRLRGWALFVLAVAVLLFYTTGTYLSVAAYVAEGFDSVRIAFTGGEGFPVEFGLADYVKAEPMGEGGVVLVGGSEAAIFSSNGTQLRYLQHNYLRPGVAAGKHRAVLYNRGGKEYTVETRSKTAAKNTTEQEILFCSMSGNGWLGVVTSSRYRANLQVLAPPYNPDDPLFTWPLVDDKPVALAFHGDNKSMVLGCLSAQDGALGTTLYLLRTDKSQVQAEIRVDNATLLQLRYLDNHRVLAVYDSYAATYNSRGQELNRYDYSHRRLLTADIYDGRIGLVFGTSTGEEAHAVLLDRSLKPQFDVSAQITGSPRILVAPGGLYLLSGQTLLGYTGQGALTTRTEYDPKLLGLAYAGEPLLVQQGEITPIADLLRQTPVETAPARPSAPPSSPESIPLPQSVPEGLYEGRSTPEPASSLPEGEEEPTEEAAADGQQDPPV